LLTLENTKKYNGIELVERECEVLEIIEKNIMYDKIVKVNEIKTRQVG
jgi:hypothetical protein